MRFYRSTKILLIFALLAISAVSASAQTGPKPKTTPAIVSNTPVKSSPAYAEVLLRKTELEASLEDLLVEYTEEFPKVRETRHEFELLQKELEKLAAVTDQTKLTLALGRLMVRKATLETDLWTLTQKYGDAHDDVKRARRKVATFEKAIKEILP